jgi:serine/threonine-protein kinase
MIYKCLEKDPEARFQTGVMLNQYILENTTQRTKHQGNTGEGGHDYEKLLSENSELKKSLDRERHFYKILHAQWKDLNDSVTRKDSEIEELKRMLQAPAASNNKKGVRTGLKSFFYLSPLLLTVAIWTGYFMFNPKDTKDNPQRVSTVTPGDSVEFNSGVEQQGRPEVPLLPGEKVEPDKNSSRPTTPVVKENVVKPKPVVEPEPEAISEDTPGPAIEGADGSSLNNRYKVKSKAYFYNLPDEDTRRRAFIIHWNNAILSPLEDKNGFIYIVFTNHLGQTSRGWLRKKDLIRVNQKG